MDCDVRGQQGTDFFTATAIIDYGFSIYISARSDGSKLKHTNDGFCFLFQTRSFSLHKMLIDELETCGLLMNYCDIFIGCLDSHSDGTHSLQDPLVSNWCNVKFQNCSDEETNSFTSWMARVHFQQIFSFAWTIPSKSFFLAWCTMWRMHIFWLWRTASKAIFVAFDSLYSEKTLFQTT